MVDGVGRTGGGAYVPTDLEGAKEQNVGKTPGGMKTVELPLGDLKQLLGGSGDTLYSRALGGDSKGLPKADSAEVDRQFAASQELVSADIFTFMALFQKLAQEMRNANREVRTAEIEGQITELQNAAGEMRKAASMRFAAAVTEGAMQIAGGVLQGVSSTIALADGAKSFSKGQQQLALDQKANMAKQIKSGSSDVGVQRHANQIKNDLQIQSKAAGLDASLSGRKADYGIQMGQALGSITSGLGGVISAGMRLEAENADASRAEAEARSKEHEIEVQHANDIMQQMMEIIRDVRSKLESINQAAVETNRGIARNI